jgi:tetratricopeptide (TPR) repeat protein
LAAAEEGFGDLGKLEGALASYCSRSRYSFLALPLKLSLTDKDFVARPLSEAEALVLRAEYLLQHRHEKEALSLLEQARALSPKSPEVQTGWGLACQHEGRYEEARVAFQEALALGSDDFRPSLHLAQMAQGHHLAESPGAQQILDWLEVARSHRPDFPGIHMALCWEYARDAKEAERALQEGFEAVKLEPRDLALRMNFGAVLMRMEREADAKKIWEQLAQMAQTVAERERIGSYKTQLDQFLARRAQGASRSPGMGTPEPGGSREASVQPLKFSLPSYLEPLGREVLRLVSEGKTDEAIRKVEKALAEAKYPYDRKALQPLLETLRARAAK